MELQPASSDYCQYRLMGWRKAQNPDDHPVQGYRQLTFPLLEKITALLWPGAPYESI
jgi:hypothetical protein